MLGLLSDDSELLLHRFVAGISNGEPTLRSPVTPERDTLRSCRPRTPLLRGAIAFARLLFIRSIPLAEGNIRRARERSEMVSFRTSEFRR